MQRGNGHGAKAAAPAGRGRKRKRGVKAARVWQREEMIPEGSADCPYILWTKMGSHPWWPARDCTEDEKERHRDVKVRGFRCLRLPTHVHRHKIYRSLCAWLVGSFAIKAGALCSRPCVVLRVFDAVPCV